MSSICLVMIVKNEAVIIEHALRSAIPFIDTWVICDTGSTDGTQQVIRATLQGIPGELHEVPWINFGANRSQSLALARDKADYLLVFDADMELRVEQGFCKSHLTADAYDVRYQGRVDYAQRLLLAARHDWRYEGVVHEYPVSATASVFEEQRGISIVHHETGSNERDDAQILLDDLKRNPENLRTIFYLAQSYAHKRDFRNALDRYMERASYDGTDEEVWYSGMMIGRILQQLEADPDQVIAAYIRAYTRRPSRLEAIYWLAQYCRLTGRHEMAFMFSSVAGTEMRYPHGDQLFINRLVWDYLMLYEFGVAAALTGRVGAAEWVLQELRDRNAPSEYLADLRKAMDYARVVG